MPGKSSTWEMQGIKIQMNPKISVITINYNNRQGLYKTMHSVAEQNYTGSEYIVIDGGSTDGSAEDISEHSARLAYWVSEPDGGIYDAMNKGIRRANGEFLLFLNSGDTFHSANALGLLAAVSEGADIIYGDLWLLDTPQPRRKSYPDNVDFRYLLLDSLPHPATLIRRQVFERLGGGYDTTLQVVADWKFFLLAVARLGCVCHHVPEIIADFDMTGLSSQKSVSEKIDSEKRKVIAEHFPDVSPLWDDLRHLTRLRRKTRSSRTLRMMSRLGMLRWLREI